MSCWRRVELRNAFWRHRSALHRRRKFLAGWRVDVRDCATDDVGEKDGPGRAAPVEVCVQFAARASGWKNSVGGNGKWDEVGRETAEDLQLSGERPSDGIVGERRREAGRDRSGDQHASAF